MNNIKLDPRCLPEAGTDAARVRDALYKAFGQPQNLAWDSVGDWDFAVAGGDGERDVQQEEFAIVGPTNRQRVLNPRLPISPVSLIDAGYVVARYHWPHDGGKPYLSEVFKDLTGCGPEWVLKFNPDGSVRNQEGLGGGSWRDGLDEPKKRAVRMVAEIAQNM